eukprot:CAMPEP_0116577484 /NCGR_PEP_ID=MMETSP0397-20121206/21174_1 /TAXON_ID=216820 /ORGANISM="Cyclophora tenuis, Strain ECT3854" /LENGTH=173 /DNA_ID=CAMNT_0004106763 /DNA_START=148 /DNA_END=669 /DNA_ORIENTATION=-
MADINFTDLRAQPSGLAPNDSEDSKPAAHAPVQDSVCVAPDEPPSPAEEVAVDPFSALFGDTAPAKDTKEEDGVILEVDHDNSLDAQLREISNQSTGGDAMSEAFVIGSVDLEATDQSVMSFLDENSSRPPPSIDIDMNSVISNDLGDEGIFFDDVDDEVDDEMASAHQTRGG